MTVRKLVAMFLTSAMERQRRRIFREAWEKELHRGLLQYIYSDEDE